MLRFLYIIMHEIIIVEVIVHNGTRKLHKEQNSINP